MSVELKTFYFHTDYLSRLQAWETARDLLNGDHRCLTSTNYLWLHSMEDPDRQCDSKDQELAVRDRKTREQRTQYTNHLKMVQDRFVSLILKGGLSFDDNTKSLLESDFDNIDGNGNSIEVFLRQVVEDFVAYGSMNILTDSETKYARTLSEEQQQGARPYWVRVHPIALMDWQISSDGSYKAFRHEYLLLKPRVSLSEEPELVRYNTVGELLQVEPGGNYTYVITTYSQTDTLGKEINYHPDCRTRQGLPAGWKLVRQLEIPELSVVPLATSRIKESVLDRVVPITLKVYNKQSELDNILHNQCYDRIFIMADLAGSSSSDGQILSEEEKTIKLSTNSLVLLPVGSEAIKLDPTDPKALHGSIRDDVTELFQLAFNMLRVTPNDSRIAESSDTRKEHKEDLLTRIADMRKTVLSVVNKAIKDYAVFKTRQNISPEISFSVDVTEQDLKDLSNYIRAHLDRLTLYPEVMKEVDKKIIKNLNLPGETELLREVSSTELSPRIDPDSKEGFKEQAKLRALVTQR